MILAILKSAGQVFCRLSFNRGLYDSFLIIGLGFYVLGKKGTALKCCFHPILSRVHASMWLLTVSVDLGHLAEIVFASFPHCKITSALPFPHCTLWKGVIMHRPHLILSASYGIFGSLKSARMGVFTPWKSAN